MDSKPGSSAHWDAADRALFSWLDLPIEQIEDRIAAVQQGDPTMAASLRSRLGKLRRLGVVTGFREVHEPIAGRSFEATRSSACSAPAAWARFTWPSSSRRAGRSR